jgi:hypothetical protein
MEWKERNDEKTGKARRETGWQRYFYVVTDEVAGKVGAQACRLLWRHLRAKQVQLRGVSRPAWIKSP